MLHGNLLVGIRATGAQLLGYLQLEPVAVDGIVVTGDIVDLVRHLGIALLGNVRFQIVYHLLADLVPSGTIVLYVRTDGSEHTGLLKKRQQVHTCAVAGQFHEVHLQLAIGIVCGRIVVGVADTLYHHGDDVWATFRQYTPKVQLPERCKLDEMVIVSGLRGDDTQVFAVVIIVVHSLGGWFGSVIVGTILQLPLHTLAQTLLEVRLHTSAAHAAIVVHAGHLVLQTQVIGVCRAHDLSPGSIDVVGGLAATAPLEAVNLVVVSPFVAHSPEAKVLGIGSHDGTQRVDMTIGSVAGGGHETIRGGIEELAVLGLTAIAFQTQHIALGPLDFLIETHQRVDVLRAITFPRTYRIGKLGVLATDDDDGAVLCTERSQHIFPVLVGHSALVPVSAHRSIDKVHLHVGRRPIVVGIVIHEDITFGSGRYLIQAICEAIRATVFIFKPVAYLQAHAIRADTADRHVALITGLQVNARGVLPLAVGGTGLQFALEGEYVAIGIVLGHAELTVSLGIGQKIVHQGLQNGILYALR